MIFGIIYHYFIISMLFNSSFVASFRHGWWRRVDTNSARSFASSSSITTGFSKSTGRSSIATKSTPFESFFTRDDVPDETLFIIDGTSLIFRAYHSEKKNNMHTDAVLSDAIVKEIIEEAKIELMTEDGVPIPVGQSVSCATLVSVVSRLVQVIDEIKPRYLAVVFDAGSLTFRNTLYPAYKQQRPPRPPDMALLFHLIPRIFRILGCECLQQPGYEADDVMATLGVWGRSRGLNVVHVSQDKDMLQLIAPGVHVLNPFKREYISEVEAVQMMGLHPSQLTDYWALTGDTSDNIPGVDSVGPKVAMNLIRHFGTLDQMLLQLGLHPTEQSVPVSAEQAITELTVALQGVRASKEKVYNNLKKSSALVHLYKQLVTLRTDVPIAMQDHWQTSSSQVQYEIVEQAKLLTSPTASPHSENSTPTGRIHTDMSDAVTLLDINAESTQVQQSRLNEVSTLQFRYRGESVTSDAITALKAISQGLIAPLNSLRYSYRKLDREL